jgi:PAS domain S-box-containing protein
MWRAFGVNDIVGGEMEILAPEYLSVFRRAASILASSLELDHALTNTISACLPALGDFGFFDVVLGDDVRRTARAYDDPDTEALLKATNWARQQRTDINLCALCSGQAVLHANTDDAWYAHAFGNAPRGLQFLSMLSVPVRYGDELIGSLTLFMSKSGRHHTEADLGFAQEFAGLAAPIVVNARLMEQQRRSEAALRSSEERLRLAMDAGKIGIWDWDIPNNKVSWSDRVYELHGVTREQFGERVEDYVVLVHPEDREPAWNKIQSAMACGDVFTNEFRLPLQDGSLRWLSTRAHVFRNDSGVAVRMIGSTMDITAQKHIEAGLADMNSRLEKRVAARTSERDRIWRMSQDILGVASSKGYFIAISPAVTAVLGWTEQEAMSMPFIEFAHPDQKNQVELKIAELAQGKTVDGFEVSSLHKNGSYRWLSWTIVPEGDLLYGIGRDITELRRQQEMLLEASELRLQLALKVGGMGAWQWDIKTGKVSSWPGMELLHGLPAGTCMDKVEDYLGFVHPDDKNIVIDSLRDSSQRKTGKPTEYRIVWADGSVHWIEGRGEMFFDQNGQPCHVAGICVDITRRKHTEQNLRFLANASAELAELVDHEETLRRIAQLAVPSFADWCAVDLIDESGGLKRVAAAHVDPDKIKFAYEIHERYPEDRNSTSGVWQIVRSGQSKLIPEITDDMLTTSIKDTTYLSIIRELGLRSYIGVPLTVRGKTLGALMFISAESRRTYGAEDCSLAEEIGLRAAIAIENSSLYRTLKQTDRRKDDFLAMLAHELRNPLAPIRAAADLLALPHDEQRARKTGEIISRQVSHMTGLVDDLLDVSRVTRGLVAIGKASVDFKKIINAATEQARPLIEKRLHQLTVVIGSGPLLVEGDEKRLVQVLSNLLNNAAKYTSERGKIELRADAIDEYIEVSVSDNGIGMPADLVANAFDLFVQGKRSVDRAQGGLGLGLALVKSLVELHGGSVSACSKGADCGSKFVIRLPRASGKIDAIETSDERARLVKGEKTTRVLIVEDNIDAAETMALCLQAVGHDVSVVHDPHDALAEISKRPYDVILMDIGLPHMDGLELARRIRAIDSASATILVALSGYGQEQDRSAALAAGIDRYLVKPVEIGEVIRLLDTV